MQFLRKHMKLTFVVLVLLLLYFVVYFDTKERFEQTSSNLTQISLVRTVRPVAFKTFPVLPINFNVFDRKCKIPRVNPFSTDVMDIFHAIKFKECTNEPDLFSVQYDRKTRKYIVHVNETVVKLEYPTFLDYRCAYFEIVRGPNDSLSWKYGAIYFEQDWAVPRRIEFMIVECHDRGNKSRLLQRDAFALVQYPSNRNERSDAKHSLRLPSVIMLGIDGMSQINFPRTMPLTAKFVSQWGWYELRGYNKVGDNTLPNILAMLTGLRPEQWRARCDFVFNTSCLDTLPFLWNNFRNAGYLTAYAEDTPEIDTFHYQMYGFKRKPVNYYLHPLFLVIESVLDKVKFLGYNYCVGRRPSFRYVFDYCLQLVRRFLHETPRPLFGLFWSNSFSHDYFNGPTSVDADFVRYLELYRKHKLFERAIVILFSDHGQRQGQLMDLPSSFLEERLPMLYIYLPPWYRRQYPEAARALVINRHRLVSTYDLHLTLRHLMLGETAASTCRKCQSILQELPRDRSCSDAGIPEHWCTCESYEHMPVTALMKTWAKLVVQWINQYLKDRNFNNRCYELKFGQLHTVERKQNFDDNGNKIPAPNGFGIYRLKFVTLPNNGLYRATVFAKAEGKLDIWEDFITRLNSYRNESKCVNHKVSKTFCLCLTAKVKQSEEIWNRNYKGTPN